MKHGTYIGCVKAKDEAVNFWFAEEKKVSTEHEKACSIGSGLCQEVGEAKEDNGTGEGYSAKESPPALP